MSELVLSDKIKTSEHIVSMNNRGTLKASGVEDIVSFDDMTVILVTCDGVMTVEGENLRIIKLCVETGDIHIEGRVSAIYYTESENKKDGGFFNKMFK